MNKEDLLDYFASHAEQYGLDDFLDGNTDDIGKRFCLEKHLPDIIREYSDSSCSCDFDDFPTYYSIKLGNQWVSVENNMGKLTVLGNHDDAGDAMKSVAGEWADYSYAEVLAFYGYTVPDIQLDLANKDDKNVKIWVKHFYYEGHLGTPLDGWLSEDKNRIVVGEQFDSVATFDTYNAALQWVSDQKDTVLNHGEYSPKEYCICR